MVAETKISYKLAKNLEWGGKSRQLKEYWKGSQGWEMNDPQSFMV